MTPETMHIQSAMCLNSAGFFSEIPLTKLPIYFEARIESLLKQKKEMESEVKKII